MGKTFEVIKRFFNDYKLRYSNETVRSYWLSLRQFFGYCNIDYDMVKAKDIRNWLAELDKQKLKPSSMQIKLAAIKMFFQYCAEENLIIKNPVKDIGHIKIEDSLPHYLTKKQLAQIMELSIESLRNCAIVHTLYDTGVRISELLNIRIEDIKWDDKQIWIRQGKGNKERFVLFTTQCSERLKAYLASRKKESTYIFCNHSGKPLSRNQMEVIFRKYSEILGIRVTPHTMRHTFAAHLIEKGMPESYVQELLGHKNIKTTGIYTRLNDQAQKAKYDSYI